MNRARIRVLEKRYARATGKTAITDKQRAARRKNMAKARAAKKR